MTKPTQPETLPVREVAANFNPVLMKNALLPNEALRACLASLVGVPLSEVPEVDYLKCSDKERLLVLRGWFKERGFRLSEVDRRFSLLRIVCGKAQNNATHFLIKNGDSVAHNPHPATLKIRSIKRVFAVYNLKTE